MSWILDLSSRRIVITSVYLWPNDQRGRIQLQKAQFEPQEGRSPIPCSLLMRCYYRWCGELMVQDEWRYRWEAWLDCVQLNLIIDYGSCWSPREWGEYVTIQNSGRSGMTSCCSVVYCETSSWLGLRAGAWGKKRVGWNHGAWGETETQLEQHFKGHIRTLWFSRMTEVTKYL